MMIWSILISENLKKKEKKKVIQWSNFGRQIRSIPDNIGFLIGDIGVGVLLSIFELSISCREILGHPWFTIGTCDIGFISAHIDTKMV